mgnify:CR=1 FL=1
MAQLQAKGLHKSFGNVDVINGIDLDIDDGDFVVVVGPSGCGKSTFLRLVAGLEDITNGDLNIDDVRVNDMTPSERGIAMVFQSYALYPHMTVRENIAFGLKLNKTDKDEIARRVETAARMLELEDLMDRLPRQLSGGQRQRVAIGRAISRDPKVFLLDEPLSNLDAALRVQTRLEIAKLHKRMKTTSIYVTHDQVEAMTLGDKIVILRDGYLEQVGPPLELYHHPANKFVAGFIGSPKMNFLHVSIERQDAQSVRCHMPGAHALNLTVLEGAGARAADTLGVRPEHLSFADPDHAPIRGEIGVVERFGDSELAYVRTEDDQTIVVRVHGDAGTKVGTRVGVTPLDSETHLFGPDGTSIPRPRRT